MKLLPALELVFGDNQRITRRAWNNRSIYCSLVEQRLCITGGIPADGQDGNKPHPWTITESDFFSDDWEALE